jgi:hypothetical protein
MFLSEESLHALMNLQCMLLPQVPFPCMLLFNSEIKFVSWMEARSSQVAFDGRLVVSLIKTTAQTVLMHHSLRLEQEIVKGERHYQQDKLLHTLGCLGGRLMFFFTSFYMYIQCA